MVKDIIKYNDKEYQLSTININGCFETMIFPIENGVISGKEVYCFRTADSGESLNKHKDIYKHLEKYISDEAITNYLKSKEEDFDVEIMDNNNFINELIATIIEEIKQSSSTEYLCNDGTVISTDVGYVYDWFKEYANVLRRKYNK